ncbi:MAG: aminotransferase class V-fold PLP-dependent enzyme [Leptospiraceae bacterium]|nr:aminotransferase class V-fold PLP-dependent enzyme [Leptospiraceae bacterium]MDW8306229.1 aminotransferase class V-fold PLP-dependent enzyme [Leptospiraceae bacterium]
MAKLEFSSRKNYIWLNNCGVSVVPDCVLTEVKEFLQEYQVAGVLQKSHPPKVLYREITEILAELFEVSPHEITLIHNTNEGFNFLSYGLDLPSGSTILLLEKEYPSNVYPWLIWEKKGVKVEYIRQSASPEEFLENLHKKLTSEVKVISISAVDWITGMPYPLLEIGQICRERDILFAVDAAQGAGHVPLKPRQMNISFMAFSAWKWLWGPLGLGGMYISQDLLPKLTPVFMGTGSVVQDEIYLPYRNELKPTAERYVTSTASLTDWVWFHTSLKLLRELSFPFVMHEIYRLATVLRTELRKVGFTLSSDKFPNCMSGIISLKLSANEAELAYRKLRENGIIAAVRESHLRFSVHLCNENKDMEQIAALLRNILA